MEQKEEILSGATELFMRYGIKTITMDEISRHLSISKKTIYQFYADKDELVMAVTQNELSKQKTHWNNLNIESKDVIEFFVRASECMKNDMKRINPTLLFDLKKYHPQAWASFQEHKKLHIVQHIKETLELGMNQGYFRQDLKVEILALMRMEQIFMVFNPDIFSMEQFDIRDTSEHLLEHFMYGVSTLKGHKRMDELKQITN